MKKLLFFSEIDKSMVSLAGGKGANLGEMTQAGVPVPPGFCLTTHVYDEFSAGLKLEGLSGPEARALLTQRELPADCEALITQALAQFPSNTLFSVRSSATAEDLPSASFAGQQDTYLNMKASDLPQAVKNCFISLYTDRAVSYRQQNGITNPSMSVVIQQMVRSDASGVLFTADPVSSRRSLLVIDAIFGLGEAIVSGLVSPDHIEYEKKTGKISKEIIAKKEFAIRPLPEGGTYRDELNSEAPVLTQAQIQALAQIALRLEEHYGAPQDIEWAMEGGTLYILQTRAITSLYPVPHFDDDKFHFLFCMGYQQMNISAMPVLALDSMQGVLNLGKPQFFSYQQKFFVPVGQHPFIDISQVLSIPPIRKILPEKMLPMMDPMAPSAIKELLDRKEKLPRPDLTLRAIPKMVLPKFPKYLCAPAPASTAKAQLAAIESHRHNTRDLISELPPEPKSLEIMFSKLGVLDVFTTFIPMVFSGIIALKQLEKVEEQIAEKGRWTKDIQVGNEGNVVTEMGLHLGDLADFVAADPELKSLLSSGGKELKDALLTRTDAFGLCWKEFMTNYGFRCAGELDISQPRWQDDPSPIIAQILIMSQNKVHGSHRKDYQEKVHQANRQAEDMLQTVQAKLGARKAKKVRKLLDQFRSYYALREHFKYMWMSNYYAAQTLLLKAADVLVSQGQMDHRNDIFHLHYTEIHRAMTSEEDLRQVIDQRREEFERVSRLVTPRILTCEGEVLMGGLTREGLPEDSLVGFGVSSGTVDGIAKVVLDPTDATVEPGEILVAPFTDPGWTPLFVNAAAVVTEIGGTLTHGAVVAREYGIPGVVGVTDATKIIKTGQKIRVDGTSGFVLPL